MTFRQQIGYQELKLATVRDICCLTLGTRLLLYVPNTAESKILGVKVMESFPVLQFANTGSE